MNADEQRALRDRLSEAEGFLEALQNHEIDAVVGRESVLLLRIRDLENEYSSLVENLPDIIFRLDHELRHIYVSPVVELYTGNSPRDLLSKTWREGGLPEEPWAAFERAAREVLESGEPRQADFEYESRHGRRCLQSRLFPEKDGAGATRSILGITADLTEQRKSEESRRQSEQRLKAAVEGANLGTWDYEPEARACSHLDARMAELYGVDPESAPRDLLLALAHPADREALAALLSPAATEEGFDHTYRVVRPDGETRWIRLAGRRADSARILGIAEDVTHRVGAEQQLERAKDQADHANKSKGEFLANMSHEIRTPLTAILGYADLLRHQVSDELGKECVNGIRLNGKLLVTILNDVLDLSKIEAGKMAVAPRLVSPRALVEEAVALMRGAAEAKALPLGAAFGPGLPARIATDPDRVKQILVNLVSNAIKFTDRGQIRVHVSYARDAGALRIAVEDSGRGVPAEHRESIFQPFEQGRAPRDGDQSGTGLGLAICRRLSSLLGGSLHLESTSKNGSVFSLLLPAAEADEEAAGPEPAPADAAEPPAKAFAGARVLVVEDQPDTRTILDHFLQRLGCATSLAASGAEALETIGQAESPPDLVLLDMRMPGIDGFETARRLRARGFDKPIVAITAHVMESDREQCLCAGCTDFLAKPIDHALLVKALRRNLTV